MKTDWLDKLKSELELYFSAVTPADLNASLDAANVDFYNKVEVPRPIEAGEPIDVEFNWNSTLQTVSYAVLGVPNTTSEYSVDIIEESIQQGMVLMVPVLEDDQCLKEAA